MFMSNFQTINLGEDATSWRLVYSRGSCTSHRLQVLQMLQFIDLSNRDRQLRLTQRISLR